MEEDYQKVIIEDHLFKGVSFHNPTTITIGKDVTIESGVVIYPNTQITGNSKIGKNSIIGPNSYIHNSTIGSEAKVFYSVVKNAKVRAKKEIGPFEELSNNNK